MATFVTTIDLILQSKGTVVVVEVKALVGVQVLDFEDKAGGRAKWHAVNLLLAWVEIPLEVTILIPASVLCGFTSGGFAILASPGDIGVQTFTVALKSSSVSR